MKVLRFAICILSLSLFACSDDSGAPDGGAGDLGPPDGSLEAALNLEASSPDGPAADVTIPARVCGSLQEASGQPIAGGDVVVCNEHECRSGAAGTTGSFCVAVMVEGDYLFHIPEQKKGGKHFADVVFPLQISADEIAQSAKIDVGVVTAHVLDKTLTLDPATGGTLDLGNGVILTVAPGVTEKPPLMAAINVGAAIVETSTIHPNLLASYSGSGSLVAALALVPLEVTFTSPIALEMPAPSGPTAGTSLDLLWANAVTGKLEQNGEATVSGGKIVDLGGKGPTALGWLLLYKK
jgi:hypothetical protein